MAKLPTGRVVGDVSDERERGMPQRDGRRGSRGLGWLSVALGSIEVLAPGAFARAIGTGGSPVARAVTRLCGVRELAAGIGILTTPRPAGWMTFRVAGDVMDLALLMAAFVLPSARRGRLLVTAAGVAGVMVLDARCAQQLSGAAGTNGRAVRARRSVTVDRPAEEVYRFWRDLSNLPRFMQRLESVRPASDGRWHVVATGPLGMRLEWDAEITEDQPSRLIAWRSLAGSKIDTTGLVRLKPAPGGRGTEVSVEIEYALPGREVTAQLAKLVGQAPEQLLQDDLRRLKQLLETGEIVVAEGALQGVGQPTAGGAGRASLREARSMMGGEGR
jgi:uncharacterized membrane protein